jgi:hypothetical protein
LEFKLALMDAAGLIGLLHKFSENPASYFGCKVALMTSLRSLPFSAGRLKIHDAT